MPSAATWMDLEIIILNKNKLTDTENRLLVAKGGEEGVREGRIGSLGLADVNYYV